LEKALNAAIPPPRRWRDCFENIADSFLISVMINLVGTTLASALWGIPISPAVTGMYLALGSTIGYGYFPIKKGLQNLSHRELPRQQPTFAVDNRTADDGGIVQLVADISRRSSPQSPLRLTRALSEEDLAHIASAPRSISTLSAFIWQINPQELGQFVQALATSPNLAQRAQRVADYVKQPHPARLLAVLSLLERPDDIPRPRFPRTV
jgi:hypothetical protein